MEMTTQIKVTPQIAKYLKALMERDKPRMAKPYIGTTDKPTGLICPACGKIIGKDSQFCRLCGQRLDPELIEL